jgi:hypothetical protein
MHNEDALLMARQMGWQWKWLQEACPTWAVNSASSNKRQDDRQAQRKL